jgi:hypothetical protein
VSVRRIFAASAIIVSGLAAAAVVATPTAATAAGCHVNLRAGVDSVRVHTYASTSAPTLGILYPGQSLQSACFDGTGGSYNDCGGGSNRWVTVYWGPNADPASVAGKCVLINPN